MSAWTPGFALTCASSLAEVLLVGGLLASSFFHLGQKAACLAGGVLMWRTSWMSREVIVLAGCSWVWSALWCAGFVLGRIPTAALQARCYPC